MRLYGQAVKTPPSHGGNPGSNPGRVTTMNKTRIGGSFVFFDLLTEDEFSGYHELMSLTVQGILDGASFPSYNSYILCFRKMSVILILLNLFIRIVHGIVRCEEN